MQKLHWIAATGSSGVTREEISPGLRLAMLKNRNIYFRVTQDECRILRVLHSSRDLGSQQFNET